MSAATKAFYNHFMSYYKPDIDIYKHFIRLKIQVGDTKRDSTEEIIMISPFNNPLMPKFEFMSKENDLSIYKFPNQIPLTDLERSRARVILLIGERRAGKTQLIHFLVNAVKEVEISDTFR